MTKLVSFLSSFLPLIPKNGRILDLGCGNGKIAGFLAGEGFSVVAVDKDKGALAQIIEPGITKVCTDAREFLFGEEFAAIICIQLLNFLYKEEQHALIWRMKENTLPGGINVVSAFTEKGDLRSEKMKYLKKGELKQLYKDWELLSYTEEMRRTATYEKRGEALVNPMHEVAMLVAKKPS